MNIKINVKGVSNKKNKIKQIDYIYPDMEYTLKDFISETVRISVRQYNKMHAGRIRPSKDEYDISEDYMDVMNCLSQTDINDTATQGKISFGVMYGKKMADEESAINSALQFFEDGCIAVFVDDNRYENLFDKLPLHDDSEVTFIRLTFLAGRMY